MTDTCLVVHRRVLQPRPWNRELLLVFCRGFACTWAVLATGVVVAQTADTKDLTNMSLEDLLKVQIVSAFGKTQSLMSLPAAIDVVTADDIHRSGATTLPEALRLVPGVDVMRAGSAYYAVSIRGFANNPSSKLLVLLDGRTLYSPYQAGVYWETEDVVMEDIERIEVIRGPGGSLWGANAVNGIINIVTKNAMKTLGGFAYQSVGNLEENRSAVQFGEKLGEKGAIRVFGMYGVNNQAMNLDGSGAHDGNELSQAGFRSDYEFDPKNRLMLQGSTSRYGLYENQSIPLVAPPYNTMDFQKDEITAANFVGRWEKDGPKNSQSSLKMFYDYLDYPYSTQPSTGTTYDIDYRYRLPESSRSSVTLGASYRYMVNDTWPALATIANPATRRDTVAGIFAQDELKLSSNEVFTLGVKLEHNDYTGFEVQPNVRFAYTPDENHTFWAASGRAVRVPSQSEANLLELSSVTPPSPGQPLPIATTTEGNPNLKAEELLSNELGYRANISDRTSIDLATFYNHYDNLIYLANGTPYTGALFGSTVQVQPQVYENGGEGDTYGFEALGNFKLDPKLRSTLGYTLLQRDSFRYGADLASPHHQVFERLQWDPNRAVQVDATLHWMDAIPDQDVPAYWKLDLHINWKVSQSLEASVGGYDLLVPRHVEFGSSPSIPRSFVLKLTYRF